MVFPEPDRSFRRYASPRLGATVRGWIGRLQQPNRIRAQSAWALRGCPRAFATLDASVPVSDDLVEFYRALSKDPTAPEDLWFHQVRSSTGWTMDGRMRMGRRLRLHKGAVKVGFRLGDPAALETLAPLSPCAYRSMTLGAHH
jgi:hypothetical protein